MRMFFGGAYFFNSPSFYTIPIETKNLITHNMLFKLLMEGVFKIICVENLRAVALTGSLRFTFGPK